MNLLEHISKHAIICSFALATMTAYSSGRQDFGRDFFAQNDNDAPPPPPMDDEPGPPPPPPPPDEGPDEAPSPIEMDSGPTPFRSSSPSKEGPKTKEDEDAAAAEKALVYKNPPLIPVTDKEKATACRKYEKTFISYSGHTYFVKNCSKFLLSEEEEGNLTRKKNPPTEVIPRILASLGEGGDYSDINTKIRTCQQFNQHYVTYNLKNYWADSCKLREFTDKETMQDHRVKNKYQTKPVDVLEYREFTQFKFGLAFDSVLDKKGKADPNDHPITAIANQEVCKNLFGRYVSYYDSIYIIRSTKKGKGCWKDKVDAAEITRKKSVNLANMRELTSDQSFSIPESDPTDVKK